jgi:hypothetical protein
MAHSTTFDNCIPNTEFSPELLDDLNEQNSDSVNKASNDLQDDIDDDDAPSIISETSTIEYDEEGYCTFQHNVRQLAADLSPDYTTECIELERMQGGDFNRIIGIKVYKP